MLLIVAAKSKFGVLNSNDNKWYNPKDKGTLASYSIGKAYDVTIDSIKGSDGKSRPQITKMALRDMSDAALIAAAVSAPVVEKPAIVAPVKAVPADKGLSFGEKDARILYQGVAQALVQSSLVLSLKELEPAVVHVVEMIKRLSGTK